MIEIKNLIKKFPPNVYAVNDLTINIEKGVNGLIGENGAGKSTLLRCIADVYLNDGGEILIDGEPSNSESARKNVFFLSDNPFYSGNGNAMATMNLYATLFDLDEERFKAMMDKLSLPLDRRIGSFSKGMRRQLFLCIALSMKAKYILLDEAFDGVDPIVQEVIKDEIIKNAEDKVFLISSHNLLSLERLCDNFILLSKGKCMREGGKGDLGQSFKKFQILFNEEVTLDELKNKGIEAVSLKKVGSVYYVVVTGLDDEQKIKDRYHPTLMESVIIEHDEIIKLEMILAKKEVEGR